MRQIEAAALGSRLVEGCPSPSCLHPSSTHWIGNGKREQRGRRNEQGGEYELAHWRVGGAGAGAPSSKGGRAWHAALGISRSWASPDYYQRRVARTPLIPVIVLLLKKCLFPGFQTFMSQHNEQLRWCVFLESSCLEQWRSYLYCGGEKPGLPCWWSRGRWHRGGLPLTETSSRRAVLPAHPCA